MTIEFSLDTRALRLIAREKPWDSEVYGRTVVSIENLDVLVPTDAARDFKGFRNWVDANMVGLVSCRLPHRNLIESMFLESQNFRFVEMVLHPCLTNLHQLQLPPEDLDVKVATPKDLDDLMEIAGNAFSSERFHLDPRIPLGVGDKRYAQWVHNCLNQSTQKLLKISERERTIGLFITLESAKHKTVDWLLTAISPPIQGLGYGKRTWRTMLSFYQTQGMQTISTTISVRNSRVLNLYSQLQFRFSDPEMTFHWVRQAA